MSFCILGPLLLKSGLSEASTCSLCIWGCVQRPVSLCNGSTRDGKGGKALKKVTKPIQLPRGCVIKPLLLLRVVCQSALSLSGGGEEGIICPSTVFWLFACFHGSFSWRWSLRSGWRCIMCPVTLGLSTMSSFPIKKCPSFLLYSASLLKAHQLLVFASPVRCCLCPVWSHSWVRLGVLGNRVWRKVFSFVWSQRPFLTLKINFSPT